MKDFTNTVKKLIPLIQDHGLVLGLGNPNPGMMCVEAAVCYAMGLEHGDDPKCVGRAVRSFKIQLNDSKWSSNKARGDGMLELAIAQLGSNTLDQKEFATKLTIKTVNVLLPTLFEKLGIDHCMKECKEAKTLKEAKNAAAYAAAYAAARSAATADAADAADAAYAAADAADAFFAAFHAAFAARYAAFAAFADAYAYATRAARAADEYLKLSAKLALEVLKEMESPGCEYLYLIKE